jgi:hypothetical protein
MNSVVNEQPVITNGILGEIGHFSIQNNPYIMNLVITKITGPVLLVLTEFECIEHFLFYWVLHDPLPRPERY